VIKSLGSAAILLGVLAGCGGGSNGAAQAPAQAAAGLEEDVNAKPASAAGTTAGATAPAAAKKIDPSLIPEPGAPIQRESYNYVGGSRDPFASVLEGASIGPELADLDVAGIWYNKANNAASVVVLRDRVSLKRYPVREGERVGRARVAEIQEKQVTFTIDDYGTTRRVTLSLRKREDNTP
jgi:hypothetical protein